MKQAREWEQVREDEKKMTLLRAYLSIILTPKTIVIFHLLLPKNN
jgi:hypothetical protein